jgi:adenine-specific DNA-methyltransferase
MEGEIVLDPYAGVASTGVAALLAGRHFIGAELDPAYAQTGVHRLKQTLNGTVRFREDKPVHEPDPNSSVARRPDHFWPKKTKQDSEGKNLMVGLGGVSRDISPSR